MTEPGSPYGEGQLWRFQKHPIRILSIWGVPWFAAIDCAAALGYGPEAAEAVDDPAFPLFAKTVCDEEPDPEVPGEPERVLLLSSVGVWYFGSLLDPGKAQGLSAWAKREALKMCPSAAPSDPHVFLTLLEGDELPAFFPWKYSGRRAEYIALRESAAYILRPRSWASLGPTGRGAAPASLAA